MGFWGKSKKTEMNGLETIQGHDIYLIDQLLKGTYKQGDLALDAGCGSGRNMGWFVANKIAIMGCDPDEERLAIAKEQTGLRNGFFSQTTIEKMNYRRETFDHIICSAVLHFAKNETHFVQMLNAMHHVLKPKGTLFIRMTSLFGLPKNYQHLAEGRYLLADGSERFLLTKKGLLALKEIGFEQIEPVKSTLVEELRSMTTLMLRKN